MSDETESPATGPELVEVSVRVPARVLADYDADVEGGIYVDRDEALRQGLVESWRFHQGRYSTIRIELRDPADRRPDTTPTPPVEDVIAASAALDDNDEDQQSGPGA